MCDYLSREQSQKIYSEDYQVQIGKIERVTNTGTYLDPPFHFDAQAALLLVELGAKLVGIDSHNVDHNIDDTRGKLRPVHKILLGNNVLICEHMTLSNYPNLRSASSLCRLKLAG